VNGKPWAANTWRLSYFDEPRIDCTVDQPPKAAISSIEQVQPVRLKRQALNGARMRTGSR
jgi:hypothetical protein